MKFFNRDKKNLSYNQYQSLFDMNNSAIWGDKNYNTFAKDGYIKNVIAFRAIRLIAVSLSSIEILLFNCTSNGKHKIIDHPLIDLLKRPNYQMSFNSLLEGIASYQLISGDAYILRIIVNNEIKELHLLRPDRIKVLINKDRQVVGYRYYICPNEYIDYESNPITGDSNILHIKSFHPLDDLYGLSTIEAASYSIDQHNQSGHWNQAYLQNGARPCGALIVKNATDGTTRNLSTTQYERIRDQIDTLYTGAKNAGRPLLLEGGLEWKEMGNTPKDMDFINMKNSTARDISLTFGVPPQLLGIPGDNTYSNLIEARLALWEQTIIPMTENLINNLSNWLTKPFDKNLCIDYNKDAIEAIIVKRKRLWDFVQKADFMTVNEKREIIGLGPIEDGDKLK